MMELQTIERARTIERTVDPSGVVAEFLSGLSPASRRSYGVALRHLAGFLEVETVAEVARVILSGGHGEANRVARLYRESMREAPTPSGTINLRLAALRSLVTFARMAGVVSWVLEVRNVKRKAYRNTAGPGAHAIGVVWRSLCAEDGPKAARDAAIVALLAFQALRRAEVVSLDYQHVDSDGLWVLGKGDGDRMRISLAPETVKALSRWIEHRGTGAGPLFHGFDRTGRSGPGVRMAASSIGHLTRHLGIGNAHGLRHTSITEGLEETGGDYRRMCRFARQANVETTMIYDDNRRDDTGKVAAAVARRIANA